MILCFPIQFLYSSLRLQPVILPNLAEKHLVDFRKQYVHFAMYSNYFCFVLLMLPIVGYIKDLLFCIHCSVC